MPSVEPLLARFQDQLAAAPIQSVLRRDYYADPAAIGLPRNLTRSKTRLELLAQRERPFAIRQEDKILTGSIDRLVIVRRDGKPVAADIIDFKTDEIPQGDAEALQEKLEFYKPQIQAYRQAVSQLLTLPPQHITARLVFLGLGRVEAINATAAK
jgi:ATP-dependent exoDNAse (exonuclease V) beta subunit